MKIDVGTQTEQEPPNNVGTQTTPVEPVLSAATIVPSLVVEQTLSPIVQVPASEQ